MSSRNAGSGTHDLSAVWHVCRTNCAPRLCPIKIEGGGTYPDLPLCDGAGEGNRTLMTSLEGWSSTIELRPRSGPGRHAVAYRFPVSDVASAEPHRGAP